MLRQPLFLICFLVVALECRAQPPYPIDGTGTYRMSDHYLYLCDSTNSKSPEQALEAFAGGKGLQWRNGTFNVGINPWIYWFKFSALNVSQTEQEAVLRISTSLASYRIFRADSGGRLTTIFQGSTATPYASRPFRHRDIAIPMQLPRGGQETLLFSVDKRNRGLYMPLYFNTLEKTLRSDMQWHWVYAWHFGIYLFVILFNVFLFFSFRDRIHLWYIGYILSAMLFMFEDEKFYVEYFPDGFIGFCEKAGTFPFAVLLLACGMKVMQQLLQQKRKKDRLYWPVSVATWCCFILSLLLFLNALSGPAVGGSIVVLHKLVDIMVGLCLVLILASTIEKIIQRHPLAVYYLFSSLTPFLGGLIYYLNHFGITNMNPVQPNGVVAGITIEIILLSFLLVIRYNNLRREKLRLLEQISEQERALVVSILDAQENERKRIALDLHDDLGGTLNALKLHISRKNEYLPGLSESEREYYLQSLRLISRASEDLRSVAHNLLPKDFTRIGLVKTIENTLELFAGATPIHFNLITEGPLDAIPEMTAIIVYRIVSEIANNIVKHSEASEATLQLLKFNGSLQIIADDNGIGLEEAPAQDGIGLSNIHSRVAFLRGTIQIESSRKGTSIIIDIPINNG